MNDQQEGVLTQCSVRGLSDADVAALRHTLEEEIEANLGMAMMFALISAAQEWLADKVTISVILA